MELDRFRVSRYGVINEIDGRSSGDFISVGNIKLGEFRDLVNAEYENKGCTRKMRPMWYNNSPFGREILKLAFKVRGMDIGRTHRCT